MQLAAGEQAQLTLAETRSGGYKWQMISPESPVFIAIRDLRQCRK